MSVPIAAFPAWLLPLVVAPPISDRTRRTGAEWVALLSGLSEGGRNDGLTRIAGLLFQSLPAALAAELTEIINVRCCKPPLPEREVNTVIESIAKREAERYLVARGEIF